VPTRILVTRFPAAVRRPIVKLGPDVSTRRVLGVTTFDCGAVGPTAEVSVVVGCEGEAEPVAAPRIDATAAAATASRAKRRTVCLYDGA
jgi:hypothetical protein